MGVNQPATYNINSQDEKFKSLSEKRGSSQQIAGKLTNKKVRYEPTLTETKIAQKTQELAALKMDTTRQGVLNQVEGMIRQSFDESLLLK